jgi:nucleotide-binding universal stress UspA family protein
MKHVMVPFRPDDIFNRAFENALNIAKQNNALLSLVKAINYPAGIGMDESLMVDLVSREYDMYQFDKILPRLQQEANAAKVKLNVHVLDMHLSPAKAFVEFASKNEVELMVVGSIAKKGWAKHLGSDISDEIMDLHPSCNVILVE